MRFSGGRREGDASAAITEHEWLLANLEAYYDVRLFLANDVRIFKSRILPGLE